jgi:hypothetical protein
MSFISVFETFFSDVKPSSVRTRPHNHVRTTTMQMGLVGLRRMMATFKASLRPRLHSPTLLIPLFAPVSLKPRSMRSHYYDNLPGDQRELHDAKPSRPVDPEVLQKLGIYHSFIPLEEHEAGLDKIASERKYKNRDTVHISRASLGGVRENWHSASLWVCAKGVNRRLTKSSKYSSKSKFLPLLFCLLLREKFTIGSFFFQTYARRRGNPLHSFRRWVFRHQRFALPT